MKVIGATLENYGAFYGKHEFRYVDRGLTMVLGENLDEPRMNSNGAAKSTLFECLDWCWYGKVPRGDHADSIINDEAKTCSVTSYLEDDDGTPAVIKRSRPNSLQFWIGGEERTSLDSNKTQEDIETFLGMDRDVFHSSTFFAQTDLLHFADVGDSKRIEILSKIIPELAVVDKYLELAKVRLGRDTSILDESRGSLLNVEGQLQGLQGIDYSEKQTQWEMQRRVDRDAVLKRIQDLEAYLRDHQVDAARLPVLEEQARLAEIPVTPKPEHGPELMEAEQRFYRLHTERGAANAEVSRLRDAIQKLTKTTTGVCSQCGQQITREHLAKESALLQTQLNEASRVEGRINAECNAAGALVNEWKEKRQRLEEEWARIEQARVAKMNEANQQVYALRQLRTYLENAGNELAGCRLKIQSIDNAVNPFLEEAKKLDSKRATLRDECSRALKKVEESEVAVSYAEYWVKAFGPKGLKSYILDSKLQEMTDAANHWVRVLTGGTFWVRFETQKKGRSTKKLSNELNIRVFRYNQDGRISDRNFKSWSGGEKKRVSLAIDFGLSRLVAKRAKKRYDLLVLDELFKHVDSAGGEAIAEMLEELKREKSSIFVIEHDPQFQTRFENSIVVRRRGSRSEVVEMVNGQQRLSSDGHEAPCLESEKKPARKKSGGRVPRRTPI